MHAAGRGSFGTRAWLSPWTGAVAETVPRLACLYLPRSVRGERLDVAGAGRPCTYTGRRPHPVTGEQSVTLDPLCVTWALFCCASWAAGVYESAPAPALAVLALAGRPSMTSARAQGPTLHVLVLGRETAWPEHSVGKGELTPGEYRSGM